MEKEYKLRYFPESGRNYSPEDFINGLTNYTEVAKLELVLERLSDNKRTDWGNLVELKHINGLIQITAGDHRVYVHVDGNYLVIHYICRKRGQKPLKKDLKRAGINIQDYLRERR